MPSRSLTTRLREYSEITHLGPILRRYFIIGAFDGALTILGIVLGGVVVGAMQEQSRLVIALSFSAAIALSISSLVGAYEAERIEKKISEMSIERAMLSEVGETHRDAFRFASIVSAGVHGIAPLIAALVPLFPFFIMPYETAVWTSVVVTLGVLFVMGAYIGGLAKERILFSGLRFVAAGLATSIILWLLGARP